MEQTIKDLIPGISDEVANQIHGLFTSKINESFELGKTTAKAEYDTLVESIKTEHETKLAESKQKHFEEIKKLNESANEYGKTLVSAYEQDVVVKLRENHTNTIAQYAQRIDDLTESANKYKQEIEDKLTESATQYVEQFINQYKQEHESLFESVEKNAKVLSLVESIKTGLEMYGFALDEDAKYKEQEQKIASLTESIATITGEKETLSKRIQEAEFESVKEKSIQKLVEGVTDISENEKAKIKKLAESIITTDITEFENIVGVFVRASLNESKNTQTQQPPRISENLNSNVNSDVSDIASKMV